MQLTSYLCQKLALPLIRISDCSYILISFDRKNRKIAFFTFFEVLENGPFKEKNVQLCQIFLTPWPLTLLSL